MIPLISKNQNIFDQNYKSVLGMINDDEGFKELEETVLNEELNDPKVIDHLKELLLISKVGSLVNGVIIDDFFSLYELMEATSSQDNWTNIGFFNNLIPKNQEETSEHKYNERVKPLENDATGLKNNISSSSISLSLALINKSIVEENIISKETKKIELKIEENIILKEENKTEVKEEDNAISKKNTRIEVEAVNDVPVIKVIKTDLKEDASETIIANAKDLEGDIRAKLSAQNGKVIIDENGNIKYTPNKDFSGVDTVIIEVKDEDNAVSKETLRIEVEAVNDEVNIKLDVSSSMKKNDFNYFEYIEELKDIDNKKNTVKGSENINGSNKDDLVIGSEETDNIISEEGDDLIFSGAGSDSINAGQGNDVIFSGRGSDAINGEIGFDTVVYIGNKSDYEISIYGKDLFYIRAINDKYKDVTAGYEELKNIEKLVFEDAAYIFNGRAFIKEEVSVHENKINIDISLNDKDSSETFEVIIKGIPEEIIVKNATKNTDGTWSIDTDGLVSYTNEHILISPDNFNASFEIEILVKSKDQDNAIKFTSIKKDLSINYGILDDDMKNNPKYNHSELEGWHIQIDGKNEGEVELIKENSFNARIMGGYENSNKEVGFHGNAILSKTFNLGSNNTNSKVIIEFDFYEIDSWDEDSDSFAIKINDEIISVDRFHGYGENDKYDGGIKTANIGNIDDYYFNNDEKHHYKIEVLSDESGYIKVELISKLDQENTDESWAIGDFSLILNSEQNNSFSAQAQALILDADIDLVNIEKNIDNEISFNFNGANINLDDFIVKEDDEYILFGDFNDSIVLNGGKEHWNKQIDEYIDNEKYEVYSSYDFNSQIKIFIDKDIDIEL